jgi:hypothetical protein
MRRITAIELPELIEESIPEAEKEWERRLKWFTPPVQQQGEPIEAFEERKSEFEENLKAVQEQIKEKQKQEIKELETKGPGKEDPQLWKENIEKMKRKSPFQTVFSPAMGLESPIRRETSFQYEAARCYYSLFTERTVTQRKMAEESKLEENEPVRCTIYKSSSPNEVALNEIFRHILPQLAKTTRDFEVYLNEIGTENKATKDILHTLALAGEESAYKHETVIKQLHPTDTVDRLFRLIPALLIDEFLLIIARQEYKKIGKKFPPRLCTFYVMKDFYPFLDTSPATLEEAFSIAKQNPAIFKQEPGKAIYNDEPIKTDPKAVKGKAKGPTVTVVAPSSKGPVKIKFEVTPNPDYEPETWNPEKLMEWGEAAKFEDVAARNLTNKVIDHVVQIDTGGSPIGYTEKNGEKVPVDFARLLSEYQSHRVGWEQLDLTFSPNGGLFKSFNLIDSGKHKAKIDKEHQALSKQKEPTEKKEKIVPLVGGEEIVNIKSLTRALIQKFAQSSGAIWFDAEGKIYPSEQALLQAHAKEWEAEDNNVLMKEVVSRLKEKIASTKPEELSDFPPEQDIIEETVPELEEETKEIVPLFPEKQVAAQKLPKLTR